MSDPLHRWHVDNAAWDHINFEWDEKRNFPRTITWLKGGSVFTLTVATPGNAIVDVTDPRINTFMEDRLVPTMITTVNGAIYTFTRPPFAPTDAIVMSVKVHAPINVALARAIENQVEWLLSTKMSRG